MLKNKNKKRKKKGGNHSESLTSLKILRCQKLMLMGEGKARDLGVQLALSLPSCNQTISVFICLICRFFLVIFHVKEKAILKKQLKSSPHPQGI